MKKLTAEQIHSIPDLLKQHKTAKSVAKVLSVCDKTIYGWVKKLNARGSKIILKRGPRPTLHEQD